MPLYLVVHHQADEKQPWVNAWLNDELIEAIQTTKEIGRLCRQAKERNEQVFVHRCGWLDNQAMICCSAKIEDVADIDNSTSLVTFVNPVPLDLPPPQTAVRYQNFYIS
jgi:hypothetical protein